MWQVVVTLTIVVSGLWLLAGLWQGEVLDIFITEKLVGTEEKTNKRGKLVVIENCERCLNLMVGDESGFSTRLQVSLKRDHLKKK